MTDPSPTRLTTPLALRGSLAAAFTFGLGEAANAIRRHRLDHLPTGEYVAGEVFWMAPAAAIVSLSVVAGLYLAICAAWPNGRRRAPAVLGVVTAVGSFGLLSAMSLGMAWWALAMLAIGLALSAVRLFNRWPVAMGRLSTAAISVGALATLAAVALPERLRARDERARAVALPAAPDNAPNVIVLIWDTARAQNMSLYGYPRRTTPVLDSVARHGLVFDRAFSTAPWSLPSHASIFTGLYPSELTTGHRLPLDRTPPTVAEAFSARGYVTASMTANLFYGSPDYGIDRGFIRYDARPPISWRSVAHTWWTSRWSVMYVRRAMGNFDTLLRRRASHVNASFLTWLDARGERPFFAVLNYFDAHEPYRAPAPFDTLFAPRGTRYWADEALRRAPTAITGQLRDMYDGGIAYDDHSLGELLGALRTRGLLERTIVVVTSDHGEEFGERGPAALGHNRSLYRQALHVPLVILGPKELVPTGRSLLAASIRDIPVTVTTLAFPGHAPSFPGRDLVAAAMDSSAAGGTVLAMAEKHRWAKTGTAGWPTSWGPSFSALSSTHQYIVDAEPSENLFDMTRDPFGLTNLMSDSTLAPELSALRNALDAGVGPANTRVARRGAQPLQPKSP